MSSKPYFVVLAYQQRHLKRSIRYICSLSIVSMVGEIQTIIRNARNLQEFTAVVSSDIYKSLMLYAWRVCVELMRISVEIMKIEILSLTVACRELNSPEYWNIQFPHEKLKIINFYRWRFHLKCSILLKFTTWAWHNHTAVFLKCLKLKLLLQPFCTASTALVGMQFSPISISLEFSQAC